MDNIDNQTAMEFGAKYFLSIQFFPMAKIYILPSVTALCG